MQPFVIEILESFLFYTVQDDEDAVLALLIIIQN